jgi:hypothetical protein
MKDGSAIPVLELERETATTESNGTLIEIQGIHLKTINQKDIIEYIQRHLVHWPKNAVVYVNNHECEIVHPPIAATYRFHPPEIQKETLGEIELVIHTSKRALTEDERGIAICSRDVWHQTTLAGSEGREMAEYIFGEIDVPELEDDVSPISPFDVSRNMQLNPANDLVRTLLTFINQHVEEVRKQLVTADKKRRATEDARKLAIQAAEIARVLNEDFSDFRNRLGRTRAKAKGGTDIFSPEPVAGDARDQLVAGGEIPAKILSLTGSDGSSGEQTGDGTIPRSLAPILEEDTCGEERGRPAGGHGKVSRSSGGFSVDFRAIGEDQDRAEYRRTERTIYINLDHPQLKAALGSGSVDDPVFRRLAYEVAFCEYAIALAMEFALIDGYYLDPFDPLYDTRSHLNRLARRSAVLYT